MDVMTAATVMAAQVCPKAPPGAVGPTNEITGYVLWGVIVLFGLGIVIAIGAIIAGRVFSLPHASKVGRHLGGGGVRLRDRLPGPARHAQRHPRQGLHLMRRAATELDTDGRTGCRGHRVGPGPSARDPDRRRRRGCAPARRRRVRGLPGGRRHRRAMPAPTPREWPRARPTARRWPRAPRTATRSRPSRC